VTGAGRRLGLHLARRKLVPGRPVIAHYRGWTDDLARLQQQGVLCVAGDLATEAGVRSLAASVRRAAPSLRAVVHNASTFAPTAPAAEDALRQLDLFYAVHLRAPFALNLALADLLAKCAAKRADIVHITDIYADNPNPAFDAYCATKAGLQNLARAVRFWA
jgi:dihydromonapterin reductase/dihydrofolate reductase